MLRGGIGVFGEAEHRAGLLADELEADGLGAAARVDVDEQRAEQGLERGAGVAAAVRGEQEDRRCGLGGAHHRPRVIRISPTGSMRS